MDRIRKIENLYVVCWLMKDMCWMLAFKYLALFMILPTILLAVYVLVLSKKSMINLSVNISMICWIAANSAWMIHDFYMIIPIEVSKVLFSTGIVTMLMYIWLVFVQPKLNKQNT